MLDYQSTSVSYICNIMKGFWALLFLAVFDLARGTNDSQQQNLTKRALNDQVTFYTDPIHVRFVQSPVYRDVSQPTPSHLFVSPKVAEPEYPKPVTVQQMVYDYQPHQIQPGTSEHISASSHLINHQPGVVTPVQHGAVINHGHGYTKYLYPVTVPQSNAPVYSYPNKITYQRPNVYPQQAPPVVTQRPFKSSPLLYITKPVPKAAPVREDIDEEAKMHKIVKEDEENDESESYEEDDEEDYKYSKHRDENNDDDDDKGRYKDDDDDDDEDSSRSYTRNVRRKPRKNSNNDKRSHSKSKSYYTRYSKPKKDVFEGRHTENIPFIHKHNSFRQEKWLVTKKE